MYRYILLISHANQALTLKLKGLGKANISLEKKTIQKKLRFNLDDSCLIFTGTVCEKIPNTHGIAFSTTKRATQRSLNPQKREDLGRRRGNTSGI